MDSAPVRVSASRREAALLVVATGASSTIQDAGRPGFAHLGVPRSGALDRPAADFANRLVGNRRDAAVVESLLGGLTVRQTPDVDGVSGRAGRWVAVTGGRGPVTVVDGPAGRQVGYDEPVWLPAGAELRIGPLVAGLRCYLAVGGGIEVAPVLGSRATDSLSGIGPAPLRPGDTIRVGEVAGAPAPVDVPARRAATGLRLHPGPRPEWFATDALAELCRGLWTVQPDSDRVGLRLAGESVARRVGELASEPMVLGAVQIPPDGQPVVFLADHPTTGGYPVVGVVAEADLWQCAQARPGERISFRLDP
ncbi:MAG: biotin-dependent carboxyltransferase family protein [Nocardioides sp.]|uniref:5-oxoprolinase subunit C family protein n=1 Tax=Nocardioides sp. TaxID=35761 RepID=UPI0039E5BDFD